ncbi:MAG: hypothetical protein FWG57_06000 [Endomicrobia bacterium]|jgi:hypothetical protein|nr:hypothetical protein [Endomicrobiia bacterium]
MTSKANKIIDEMTRLYNRGVAKAQEENRKMGLPNVFYRNGRIIYEMPNGSIRTKKLNKKP